MFSIVNEPRVSLYSVVFMVAAFGSTGTSLAQVVPPDFTASPDVYKVVAENAQYRLVEGTWKPGQRDRFHSHSAMMFYWVTDCSARFHFPNGSHQDMTLAAGQTGVQTPIASHSLENVGTSECKIVMFEPK
jgi:beta-alanine degradation protein BauB